MWQREKYRFFYLIIITLIFSNCAFAHVELTYPEGGETFYSGDTVTITWVQVQPHDTQNWELYYSPDGAESWQVISNNIASSLREFNWVVPAEETTMGRIRVVQNNTETDYDDVSANINIVNVTGVADQANNLSVNSVSAYPNPFVRNAKISFTLVDMALVTLDMTQLHGKKITTLLNGMLPPGDYLIDWNPEIMTTETYLVILTVGDKRKVIKLQQLLP